MYPLFGTWLTGLQGILLIDASIAGLALLTWGTARRQVWAWWGSLLFFAFLASSTISTCLASTYPGVLSSLNLPPTEVEFLDGIPLQGFHLALLFGTPLALTLVVIARSRRHFNRGGKPGTTTGHGDS